MSSGFDGHVPFPVCEHTNIWYVDAMSRDNSNFPTSDSSGETSISRRRLVGTGIAAAGLGLTTQVLPAAAEFNSYIGYTEASGDAIANEEYVFRQLSRKDFLINFKRAPEASSPISYTVWIEAYFIPPGNATPVANPFNYRPVPGEIATMNAASTTPPGVYFEMGGAGGMFPSLNVSSATDMQKLQGTRFRATFVTTDGTNRTINVPFDGLGLGDRWEFTNAPSYIV